MEGYGAAMNDAQGDFDGGLAYRAARHRIVALVTAPGVDHDAIVPATPEWSVHDLVAHLAGIARDAATGNMAGAPGDAWTAAQVERSRGLSVADLVAQWEQDAPMIEAFFSSAGAGLAQRGVIDIHTHEADLLNALGRPVELPADFLQWVGALFREELRLVPRVSDLELLRARLGRRTEAEVRAYDWPSDPGDDLDWFFAFGIAERSLGEVSAPT
ncbi:MAG: hypothetical protein RLZ04_1174 [Actinomycetota bacterium]